MASETWTDEDYVALRNYELRLERQEQIRRLDERHETRIANDREPGALRHHSSDVPVADDGD